MNKKISAILGVVIMTALFSQYAYADELPPSVTDTETTAEDTGSDTSTGEPETTDSSTDDSSVNATEAMGSTSTETDDSTSDTSSETEEEETPKDESAFKDFADVSVDHQYYNAIIVLRYQELLQGYGDNTFRPDQPLNRVEALKLVFEAAEIEVTNGIAQAMFSDTEETAWYSGYLNKAVFLEVVNGYADSTFRPEQSVNLVEFLKMLLLTQKADIGNAELAQIPYADVMPGQWYSKYVNYAKIKDMLVADYDNKIYPAQPLSRGRAADIIYRFRNIDNLMIGTEEEKSSDDTGAASEATVVPVENFALYVSQGWNFAVQYPKYWFYSSFIDKVDENDIAIYGFGPDDLTTNDPAVTLELLPNDESFEATLVHEGFSYYKEEGTDGMIHLSAKVEDSSRIYRISGAADQETNMLNMLSSITVDIAGLETFNPAEVDTTTEEETTSTPDETATNDDTTTPDTPVEDNTGV